MKDDKFPEWAQEIADILVKRFGDLSVERFSQKVANYLAQRSDLGTNEILLSAIIAAYMRHRKQRVKLH